MLVLTRGLDECIRIGDDITVTVCEVMRSRVRLGVTAPKSVPITRAELLPPPEPEPPPPAAAAPPGGP